MPRTRDCAPILYPSRALGAVPVPSPVPVQGNVPRTPLDAGLSPCALSWISRPTRHSHGANPCLDPLAHQPVTPWVGSPARPAGPPEPMMCRVAHVVPYLIQSNWITRHCHHRAVQQDCPPLLLPLAQRSPVGHCHRHLQEPCRRPEGLKSVQQGRTGWQEARDCAGGGARGGETGLWDQVREEVWNFVCVGGKCGTRC